MTRPCPTCDGDGVVLSEETVAIEFERRLRDLGSRAPRKTEAFLVQMNPRVSSQFTGNGARVLHLMEIETGKHFLFTGSEGLPLDHFEVVMEGALDEIRDEAIPFRDGDEVFVTIVEPHMYEVDDAVAKIDGYIVSVAGGGAHVGEKRLVRIVEAGRTAATAVLVDNGAGPAAKTAATTAAKPKSTTTRAARPRRKKATADEEAAAEAAVASSDADERSEAGAASAAAASEAAGDTAAGGDEAGAEPPEAAPAPKRRTRRKPATPAAEERAENGDQAVAEPSSAADGDETPEGQDEGDAVESKPRRRGRRGGRRRSAAKAEATKSD
jgi:ribonuclease G